MAEGLDGRCKCSPWHACKGDPCSRNLCACPSLTTLSYDAFFLRRVLDRTGLEDRYTFLLKWRPDETQFSQMRGLDVPQEAGTEDNEDIYTSARQQLGIKIESTRTLAPTMVIKTVSHPSPN